MKFRKRPIVIEAFQMTEVRRYDNKDWPDWLNRAWNKDGGEGAMSIDSDDPTKKNLCVGTLEGVYRITWNDWIIQGVKGEIYPCKPDIFALTYESTDSPPPDKREALRDAVVTAVRVRCVAGHNDWCGAVLSEPGKYPCTCGDAELVAALAALDAGKSAGSEEK